MLFRLWLKEKGMYASHNMQTHMIDLEGNLYVHFLDRDESPDWVSKKTSYEVDLNTRLLDINKKPIFQGDWVIQVQKDEKKQLTSQVYEVCFGEYNDSDDFGFREFSGYGFYLNPLNNSGGVPANLENLKSFPLKIVGDRRQGFKKNRKGDKR